MQDRELPPLDLRRIPMNLRSSEYKLGDEFKPFHPSASHVPPEYRDGWNRCWLAAQIQFARIRADEREECAKLISTGDYCRYVEHAQGYCDCSEMASAIRSRIPKEHP